MKINIVIVGNIYFCINGGRTKIFYLTMHSTYFTCGYMALDIKDNFAREEPAGATLWTTLWQQVLFYMHHPKDRIAHYFPFDHQIVSFPKGRRENSYNTGLWLPLHLTTLFTLGTTLSSWQQGIFYMHHPTESIAHTTAFS